MNIIGIESSCDDSCVAVFSGKSGIIFERKISQLAVHKRFGGVVPELAARAHVDNFAPLLYELKKNGYLDLRFRVAVTYGPGLAASLSLGIAFANTISAMFRSEICGVNHLRGHAFSPFISIFPAQIDDFLPHLGLLVSGGNTILFEICDSFEIKVLAETVDDAAGEAFDKGAKLLGLRYPGGPEIEKLAQNGDRNAFKFPRAFFGKDAMKFSFSGLKTSLRYMLEKIADDEVFAKELPNICASYEAAIVDALVDKVAVALDNKRYVSIGVSGGVSNNMLLRNKLTNLARACEIKLLLPELKYTEDNAAMIAFAAHVDGAHTLADVKNFNTGLKIYS
ncbi:MAG: tRNA (adenosine(37)-N6)-threonylcarbamoyltransferase complex transferase subunit TsaD [Puniceicoccales bacterium]|jgi:N6-L-threonylcarbamoyladenine synthase|nr:tRNA (adenosine(37)-N6)-threonylcarbamoyltransferase complex transferase subunit TsaD [Puniceicoccales bacterium]